jgi:hypothetical protein
MDEALSALGLACSLVQPGKLPKNEQQERGENDGYERLFCHFHGGRLLR